MTTTAKPAPLGDATNVHKPAGEMDAPMKERVTRTHTKFDEEGNVAETTVTEVEQPAAEEAAPAEEEAAPEEEAAIVADADAEAEGETEGEADPDAAAKKMYREVPSFFNTEKERTAKWAGKHTRFPEDDAGEDDAPAAPVSEEMQSKIDELSTAVTSAMVVEPK